MPPGDTTYYQEFQRFAEKLMDEEAQQQGTTRDVIEQGYPPIRRFLERNSARGI
jgi:hypothetical protein